ncbi:chromate transporter [Deinococcus actinosclerus]|uniref:Chromate transporter n=1 Tax=Deinococcus actinosclerus TaxID=1768108 RepID=A0ABM5X6I0_9DEIO|nr:chromate transporter [Deinococcus actinosclerus]ALW89153.1 chromate transporter [Deinococcus actinosclerus]
MSAPTTPAASAAPATPTPPPTPAGLLRLFVGVALVGIGGGLPAHTRRALTTRGWMTDAEFAEAYTLAQLTPGPNAVNLAAMIGARLLGGGGAALAVVGILTPGLIAMLTVTVFTLGLPGGLPPAVQSGLRGAACAALGVMLTAALPVLKVTAGIRFGPTLAVITFLLLAVLRADLLLVLAGTMIVGLILHRPRSGE